ncbi:MAG TPA: carbohydrate binding domain-containing protein, partial [Ilumatobacteraceae bacterium]|nr:carbohydrate binding domain-containing protein [Ilumatobacteraceae bacterium]
MVDESVDGTDPYAAGPNYRHDSVGRLASARVSSNVYEYGYDNTPNCGANPTAGANTNRTDTRVNGGVATTYCYDHTDRVTSYGTAPGTYAQMTTPGAPGYLWRLGETSGTTATATYGGGGANGTYSATTVQTAGFEGTFDGWAKWPGSGMTVTNPSNPAVAHTGSGYLAATAATAGDSVYRDTTYSVQRGATYRMTAWIKSASGSAISGTLTLWGIGGSRTSAA